MELEDRAPITGFTLELNGPELMLKRIVSAMTMEMFRIAGEHQQYMDHIRGPGVRRFIPISQFPPGISGTLTTRREISGE